MLKRPNIRTMVIDDSLVFRKFLIDNLPQKQARIEIVGYAVDAFDAMKKIPELKPDVITLDIEMPKMSGIDFLQKLLPQYQIPVILVSSLNIRVFDALSSGAVDFVKKPDMNEANSTEIFLQNLAGKILIASQAKVRLPNSMKKAVKPANNADKGALSGTRGKAVSASGTKSPGGTKQSEAPVPLGGGLELAPDANSLRLNGTVIAIGASTGGTEATLEIMKQLPADIPGIVITQHMPKGFTKMYAERLDRLCRMKVKEAEHGDIVQRGVALLAPGGDLQMKVVKRGQTYQVVCVPGEKVSGHRPSVDVLFQSVSESVKQNAVGIILTGMGADGARGLLQMKNAGAYTIGQDKESSVVYGMPMVANDIGAVQVQSSCTTIPRVLIKYLNSL